MLTYACELILLQPWPEKLLLVAVSSLSKNSQLFKVSKPKQDIYINFPQTQGTSQKYGNRGAGRVGKITDNFVYGT